MSDDRPDWTGNTGGEVDIGNGSSGRRILGGLGHRL